MEAGGGSDVRDILELDQGAKFMTKDALLNDNKKKPIRKSDISFKRPEGMHRELWGLLWTDNKDAPPLIPTDTNQGYKQMKAKIGISKVRPWKWMPFSNPARKDGAVFHHWRRLADEGKDYPFARFNKAVDTPTYSDLEYQQHLHDDNWTRQETDHLFDLCKKFDLRFVIMHDRWDREKYSNRSVEDMKERYYGICGILTKVRAPQGTEPKIWAFDAEHERKRKLQMTKLFERTQEKIEEEDLLIAELKKIELRKKEREKKTQDLQKLITAADSNIDSKKADKRQTKKKIHLQQKFKEVVNPDQSGIKFADFKASGVSLRSQRMKLPASIGQKKMKAIEQVLEELGIEFNPMPTEEVVSIFNELRQDIVLLYELKSALANCDYETETLRHRLETVAPGKSSTIEGLSSLSSLPETPVTPTETTPMLVTPNMTPESPNSQQKLAEAIDIIGSAPGTPNRKRKAALEQRDILKKITKKL
ncbi:DNA methyltransferase 1-associated protein 1-like [Mytilus trossulus]|uniref:DNA methyltransferase 1-associated protein 1-like n=1 Tax=Mytilus trossulus TaxID=6551 RepID=UPI003005A953